MPKYDDLSGRTRYDMHLPYADALKPVVGGKVKLATIKRDLSRVSFSALVEKGTKIDTNMTGKPAYTSIQDKITAFHGALTAFGQACTDYDAAVREVARLKLLRDETRAAFVNKHGVLASATEGITQDGPTLIAIGWDLRGEAGGPIGPLPAPMNLNATYGDFEGTSDLSWDPVYGARFYKAQRSTSSEGPWTDCYADTASSCTVNGLTPGTQYWFRVCAHGGDGDSPWSDPATKRSA